MGYRPTGWLYPSVQSRNSLCNAWSSMIFPLALMSICNVWFHACLDWCLQKRWWSWKLLSLMKSWCHFLCCFWVSCSDGWVDIKGHHSFFSIWCTDWQLGIKDYHSHVDLTQLRVIVITPAIILYKQVRQSCLIQIYYAQKFCHPFNGYTVKHGFWK